MGEESRVVVSLQELVQIKMATDQISSDVADIKKILTGGEDPSRGMIVRQDRLERDVNHLDDRVTGLELTVNGSEETHVVGLRGQMSDVSGFVRTRRSIEAWLKPIAATLFLSALIFLWWLLTNEVEIIRHIPRSP